jgi:hypothetical protein
MALTLSPPITWSSCRASGAGADGGCHDRGVRVVWSKWPFDCSRRCTTSARPELAKLVSHWEVEGAGHRRLLSLLRGHRVKKLLKRMLDETEFLSDYGVRALSRHHEAQPYVFDLMNGQRMSVGYKPAESDTGLFGGNSNWRGPIWFPVNCLIIESLQMFHHYYGDELRVEWPTGSGQLLSIGEVADEL